MTIRQTDWRGFLMAKGIETRAEWETCCPGRPHADELDMLRDHLAARDRENTELRTQISRELQERIRRERDVYAAAKRAAWDHVLFKMEIYVWADARRHIWDLIRVCLLDVPDTKKAREDWIARFQLEAHWAKKYYDQSDDPMAVPAVSEIVHFREALKIITQRLHAEHDCTCAGRCGCLGCEITRDVHEATLPEASA